MYGIQDKINQILRGAETIRKNQSMQPLQPVNSTTTFFAGKEPEEKTNEVARLLKEIEIERKRESAGWDEIARLREQLRKAEELIRGLHDGWKKARKAHLETCKNAQAEIDKLHTENVCLQELIQEFYEWSRRDYPTEAEVREIMDRYYNLLNK
jgi:predicted Zn-dependent protease